MPGTITTDLSSGVVDAADVITNWLSLGTWGTAMALNPDLYLQGTGCCLGRCSGPNQAFMLASKTSQVNIDLSTGAHVFIWMKCAAWAQQDTKARGGLRIVMSSDATPTASGTLPNIGPTNSKSWYVAGSDTDFTTGWMCYVVDPTSTSDLAIGSMVIAQVKRIGLGTNTLLAVGGGSVKIPNLQVDVVRYGTGMTINDGTSGAPAAFADIFTFDSSTANCYGVITKQGGIYYLAGKLNFGTAAQTAITYFADTNQVLVWQNFTRSSGNNLVATGFYEIKLAGAASFNTTFKLGTYSSGLTSGGCVIRAPGNSIWTLTASAANTVCLLYGCTLSQMYRAAFASNSEVRGCVFDTFGDITTNGALIDKCTFQNVQTAAPISGSYGLIVNSVTQMNNITNCSFINCATAIKLTTAGDYTFNGHQFSGNTHMVEFSGTGTVNITPSNGSNIAQSGCIVTGGGTINVNNNKTLTLTGLKSGSDIVILTAGTSTERVNIDANSGTTYNFSYAYSANDYVDICVYLEGYIPFAIRNFLLPSVDSSLPISQVTDRNFSNPA